MEQQLPGGDLKSAGRSVYQHRLGASVEKTKKRLLSKVTMTDSGCWILTRSIKKMKRGNGGYGEVGYRGRTVQAHRLMYGLCYGEPPLDKCVMHECDVRPCIRPEHLKLGTHHDNMLDMCRKGRLKIRSGEACHFAKLTAYDIREIRELYATEMLSTAALAEMFRVTPGLISHIVNHRHRHPFEFQAVSSSFFWSLILVTLTGKA